MQNGAQDSEAETSEEEVEMRHVSIPPRRSPLLGMLDLQCHRLVELDLDLEV